MKKIPIPIGTVFGLWTVTGLDVGRKLPCICKCGKVSLLFKHALIGNRSTGCVHCINGARNKRLIRENSPSWHGGKHIDDNGYIQIYKPGHHRAKINGYVREHVLVMETKLNRPLLPNENVHHLNGIRSDNRSENLELWVKSQPSGQRAIDLVTWAKEIIKIYAS